jgi:hypothetical protein
MRYEQVPRALAWQRAKFWELRAAGSCCGAIQGNLSRPRGPLAPVFSWLSARFPDLKTLDNSVSYTGERYHRNVSWRRNQAATH